MEEDNDSLSSSLDLSSSETDVMRYGLLARTRPLPSMRYNETVPCPMRPTPSASGASRALQRRHSWANAQFQRAFDNDDGNNLGVVGGAPSPNGAIPSPQRPNRHSFPRNLPRNHSTDSSASREEFSRATLSGRRSRLTRMGSSFDSSMRSSSALIASKMRSVRDKLRQHAIQQSAPWPPPGHLFADRYLVSDSHPLLPTRSSLDRGSASSTPARSRRSFPPRGLLRRRRSSESDSVYSSDAGDSNGIVCSELDLKAILSDYKAVSGPPTGGSVDHAGRSSGFFSLGCATPGADEEPHKRTVSEGRLAEHSRSFTLMSAHKRRHFRKQVSFDDRDYYIGHSERKVSAIQEEIELAAMQATGGPKRAVTCDDVTPEDDDRADENRPLLGGDRAIFKTSLSSDVEEEQDLKEAEEAANDVIVVRETVSCPSTPRQPKEVEYDEHGQTWEIYGAEFDPNILGEAIQKHLETMIRKDFGEVFDDIDTSYDEEASRPDSESSGPSKNPKPQLRRLSDGDSRIVGIEESRNRFTRLCSILFCVRGRRRTERKVMR